MNKYLNKMMMAVEEPVSTFSKPIKTKFKPCLSVEELSVAVEPVRIPFDEEEHLLLDRFRTLAPWDNVPSMRNVEGLDILDDAPKFESDGTGSMKKLNSFSNLEQVPQQTVTDRSYWLKHFKEFCTDACLMRYLRANSFNVDKAYEALIVTLEWRKYYAPHLIDPAEVKVEAACGKQYHHGFSNEGMPVIYLRNHLDFPEKERDYPRSMRYLVFAIEHAIKTMPDGVEKVVLIFDFRQYSPAHQVPLNVSKYFLHLFATHYPERLGYVFACGAPWYFWIFYKMISPFINPVTTEKFRFVDFKNQHKISMEQDCGSASNVSNFVDKSILEKEFGGDCDFVYEVDAYWQSLMEIHQQHSDFFSANM